MKIINHIQQKVANFAKKQIKLKYHTINTYGNEKAILTGSKR